MTRALTEQTRHWRIPAYFYEFMSTVRRTDSKLAAELGREPTQEEVFRESGLTMEQFQTANRCLLNSLSLDSPLSYESGDRRTTLGDTVAGDVIHPEDELENNMLRRDLEKILEATLTPRERDVIRMRFGLDDGACKTLDEISSIFCVTRERIRHLELSALRKLRHPYRCILLKDYVSVKNKGLADFFSRSLSGEEEGFLDK
jgi:RNA polymerase primary sigma factor